LFGPPQSATPCMLSNRAQSALYNIRHNILAAQRFTAGLTFEQFKQSDLHFYAVMRALEIVSEAARRLPESFRDKHPELPWKQIMGIGNVLRHDYDNVVETIVWETTTHGLWPLLAVVASEIEALDPPQ
jgi:uncharacterized protein with HEPN domain